MMQSNTIQFGSERPEKGSALSLTRGLILARKKRVGDDALDLEVSRHG
jgi:hypothetical protein